MKIIPFFLALIIVSPAPGDIKHKENIFLEYGKKWDSNIIYPDSVTNTSALVTDFTVRPSFLLQIDKRTMTKLKVGFGSEELSEFQEDNIKHLNLSTDFRHLFSHLTMIGANLSYDKRVSENQYYAYDKFSASAVFGRYFNPLTNMELTITGIQKTFPNLYRYSLSDMRKKSYYYDYRHIDVDAALKRKLNKKISLNASLGGEYKDFYNDVHDSDYVGAQWRVLRYDSTFVNAYDINGDSIFIYDTLEGYVGLYELNIQQKDNIIHGRLYLNINPISSLYILPRVYGKLTFSNDAYFNSKYIFGAIKINFGFSNSLFSTFLNTYVEYYPERTIYADGERDLSHLAGFIYQYKVNKNIRVSSGFYFRKFDSSADFEDYTKKIITASINFYK
jgi:hypothetical protein